MYNEFRYPSFIRGLVVMELPVIIDVAIARTIGKYGSLVNHPKTRLEQLLIFSTYMSFALEEIGNFLVSEAVKDIKRGLSSNFLQQIIDQIYSDFHREFVSTIASFEFIPNV